MENQCIGLAEAMSLDPEIKRIKTKKPWRWLPPQLWISPLQQLKTDGDQLAPPWPDTLISCGRQAIPMSIAIKKASKGKTFTVHIQTPNTSPSHFDLVIVPKHDRLRGPNVIVSEGSLTRITPEKLKTESNQFPDIIPAVPHPIVAVLVGGSNRCYSMTAPVVKKLCDDLKKLHQHTGCFFLVTASRRTGDENTVTLKETLSKLPHYFWDGSGDNPYFAFLEKADAIIVTADSVNMVCEAVSAGKPTLVFDLEGGNRKFNYFHDRMKKQNYTRAFEGSLPSWDQPVLRESQRVAEIVRQKYQDRPSP
ncbi:mitochondrial fission ELM1 family protein [Sneathiella limimaris]|uniref:mitochondrial fission ELM1 family protein n=1 Tax=Sneathiella limimaris TaxID=1964213 RepID=UPI0019D0274E|nr:mitochondrial fission ELM1 family protein [Sneathiella limimaris]